MSVLQVNVNVAFDPTLGVAMHTLWATVPIVPAFAPSVEMIATQMWTAGYLMGKNKFTTTVKHKQFPICQASHDLGILIPDVTIPPTNLFYPLMWPFSKRKMMFSASKVKFNDKAVGCSIVGPLPMPMMTCANPASLPTAVPLINLFNTLKVGMTPGDFVLGVAKIIASIAIDLILSKIFASSGPKGSYGSELGKGLMGKMGLSKSALASRAAHALAGFAFSAIEGNPTFSFGLGGGPISSSVKISGEGVQRQDIIGPVQANFGIGADGFDGDAGFHDPLHIFTDPE